MVFLIFQFQTSKNICFLCVFRKISMKTKGFQWFCMPNTVNSNTSAESGMSPVGGGWGDGLTFFFFFWDFLRLEGQALAQTQLKPCEYVCKSSKLLTNSSNWSLWAAVACLGPATNTKSCTRCESALQNPPLHDQVLSKNAGIAIGYSRG